MKKRLIPFIKEKYPAQDYIFWPDLASSHYAASTVQLLESAGVKFLAKERNPPNVPLLRPIEKFWAHFKAKMFSQGYRPKDVDCLMKKARKTLKAFDTEYFERLMGGVGTNVRAASTRGVLSVIN